MLVLILNVFQLFRPIEKSLALIQETEYYQGQTALLVGNSNRKISYALTSFPEVARPEIDQKVVVLLPNKDGKKNQQISGSVIATDSNLQLSLIKLEKKIKKNRVLEFKTGESKSNADLSVLEKKSVGKRLGDYYLAKDKGVSDGGLTPIVTEKEEIVGLYGADNTLISAKDAVAFLAKYKVTVHANGSKKQELVLSTFAAFNIVVLYVLLVLHRRRKKASRS